VNQRCRWDDQALFRMIWMPTCAEMPRSPGHAFYDLSQDLLGEAGFDAFVEQTCKPYCGPENGRTLAAARRYFRTHMIGYFGEIDSERGVGWRSADSFSLRDFLRCRTAKGFPIIPDCRGAVRACRTRRTRRCSDLR
jgi:hypothetical protein